VIKSQPSLAFLRKHLILVGIAKGMIFWYAIEKLFEVSIGITPEQIILIGIVAQGSKILFELPTSVFADRWNRKNTLIIAGLLMILCSIVMGFANSVLVYVVGTIIWSLSDALNSGVYEAFTYDSLKVAGYKAHFQKIYTRMKSGHLTSMALAGIVAGIISTYFNVRLPFFLSIFPVAISVFLLVRLKEPFIQRTTSMATSWWGHISDAAKLIASSKLRWPVVIYICLLGLLSVWYEYYQLLGVDIKLSPILFGSLITVLTLGMVMGAEIAHKKAGTKLMLVLVWLTLMTTHLVGLRFGAVVVAFVSLFITFVALQLQEVYLEIYLQDNIPSERRATIMSLIGTVGYGWFFLLAAIIVFALQPFGIRGALTLASLPLVILGIIDLIRGIPWASDKRYLEALPEEAPKT
jgi:MFS family permease